MLQPFVPERKGMEAGVFLIRQGYLFTLLFMQSEAFCIAFLCNIIVIQRNVTENALIGIQQLQI